MTNNMGCLRCFPLVRIFVSGKMPKTILCKKIKLSNQDAALLIHNRPNP